MRQLVHGSERLDARWLVAVRAVRTSRYRNGRCCVMGRGSVHGSLRLVVRQLPVNRCIKRPHGGGVA
jgi:hypothetical protein